MRQKKTPRYYQVALIIAERIRSGQYEVGMKLNECTTLATNFHTSPETVRRALNVLADIGIVEVVHGSGAIVLSKKKAGEFLDNYNSIHSIRDTRNEILESIRRQESELSYFSKLLDDMIFETQKAQRKFPFTPYEIEIDETCLCLHETLKDLRLWNRTEATVIAIKRGDDFVLSPGPYAMLESGDVLFFVGDEYAKQRMQNLLYGIEKKESVQLG